MLLGIALQVQVPVQEHKQTMGADHICIAKARTGCFQASAYQAAVSYKGWAQARLK